MLVLPVSFSKLIRFDVYICDCLVTCSLCCNTDDPQLNVSDGNKTQPTFGTNTTCCELSATELNLLHTHTQNPDGDKHSIL